MIHICLCMIDLTGHYSKFLGTTMLSVFENTNSEVTVHILHDSTLTQDNRDKFIYLTGRYGQAVKFYNVEELCADRIAEINFLFPRASETRYTIAMFYRFFIPQVLSADIDKCIYLDADIIANLNINELWKVNLADKPLAAVPEILIEVNPSLATAGKYLVQNKLVDYEDYFNSGVLLMNLKVLRDKEEEIRNGLNFISDKTQYTSLLDQDVLNYLFSKNYVKLPKEFDIFMYQVVKETTQPRAAIYHYIMNNPQLNMNDPFNRLWMKYFMKTPWFDEDAIGRLYEGFAKMHGGLKTSMISLSAMMSGKTRAFFVTPQDVEMIKKVFSVQKGEDIILAENQDSIKKLIKAMKRSQGKKVFFIALSIFPFNVLLNEGFVFGKDFLNGAEFLSGLNDSMPFDSYALIKDM